MSRAFYVLEDGLFHPQEAAGGGAGDKTRQSGVAASGLLTDLMERLAAPSPMQFAKVVIDLLRPIPLCPVATEARIERDGRQMQMLSADLRADGELVARASALRVRLAQTPAAPESAPPWPDPQAATSRPVTRLLGPGRPMETRMLKGRDQPGPGAYWTRFNAELVEGRSTSPSVRAAMAADMAIVPARVVDRGAWTQTNLDSSLYFSRAPRGEWVLTECETFTAGAGSALVTSLLADEQGPFGRAIQTLVVAPLTGR